MAIFFKFTTVVLLAFVGYSEALTCHYCIHLDADGYVSTIPRDYFCRDGPSLSIPSVDCETADYVRLTENILVPKTSYLGQKAKNTTIISPDQRQSYSYSCLKLTLDGELVNPSTRADLTTRNCVRYVGSISDTCYSNERSKIGADIDSEGVRDFVSEVSDDFTNTSIVGFCTCSGDYCNGAMSTVSVSVSILLMSTLFLNFVKSI